MVRVLSLIPYQEPPSDWMGVLLVLCDCYSLPLKSQVNIRIRMIGQQTVLIAILEEFIALHGIIAGAENMVKVSGGGDG